MATVKGVKEYNRIRRYMEHIYLYGFFSREDFERSGIGSAKDYDFGTALLRSIYADMDGTARWENGRKHLRFSRRYNSSGEDRLSCSYLFHSIDESKELIELILILLSADNDPKTMDDIHAISDRLHHGSYNLEYATSRRRFLELVEHGYFKKEGRRYRSIASPFQKLTDEEVNELYSYVCFSESITYPQVAGSFLKRSLARELWLRGIPGTDRREFLFRRNANNGVFDEEIAYELMRAIRSQKSVELIYENRRIEVIPVALKVDTHLGRWYLLAYWHQRPMISRISKIIEVKEMGVIAEEEWQNARTTVMQAYQFSGCSGNGVSRKKPVLVEAQLCFGDNYGMRAQFLREKRMGSVISLDGKQIYRAYVSDPLELYPFLRTYSPWIKILPGEHSLDQALVNDLQKMKTNLQMSEEFGNETV